METDKFNNRLDIWSQSLANSIATSKDAGRKVYVIALSRKMPRFFDWLQNGVRSNTITSQNVRKLCNLLESEDVELTTEYAIPLIFNGKRNPRNKKITGIIADDVIIFGATLQRVSMQWWAFSSEIPKVTALFRGMGGIISSILETDDTLTMPRLKDEDLESVLDTIAKKIHSTSLPIDMEYPLIYTDMPYETVRNHMFQNCPPEWYRYDVKSKSYPDNSESFTVILGEGKINGYTNDRAKIRLFKKASKCCLEMIAPNYMSLRKLKDENLFSGNDQSSPSEYERAWQKVFKRLNAEKSSEDIVCDTLQKSLINNAKQSTLIIWAEYLYCLSVFINNRSYFFPNDAHIYIRKEDLSLILGKASTKDVIDNINSIIINGEVCNPDFEYVALQDYVHPEMIKDLYFRKVASAIKENVSVSDNLDALFNVSHFSGDICKVQNRKNILGHHCIGESFESIKERIKLKHHDDKNLLQEIHKWIDVRIDESRVAPKYEIVVGSDKQKYFRRLFLCGTNKI